MAKRYNEAGINCLIDFNASPDEFKEWQVHFAGLDYKLIVLLPSKDTVLARNNDRSEHSKLKDNKVLQNYEKLAKWSNQSQTANIINNSEGVVSKTVDLINELLK